MSEPITAAEIIRRHELWFRDVCRAIDDTVTEDLCHTVREITAELNAVTKG